jgi:hypothetical protein
MAESLGLTSDTSQPDDLLISDQNISTIDITLLSGQNGLRGDLLGKITDSTPTVGTAGGGNTGDGTMTAVTAGGLQIQGTYVIECIAAAVDAGTFKVLTPEEVRLDDAEVGVAYVSDHLNFTLNDGATDFIVGDKFTVAVAAGSGKYVKSLAAAVDGSQDPVAILFRDTDASSEDLLTKAYRAGEFESASVNFGAGHTAASTTDALRSLGIHLTAGRA